MKQLVPRAVLRRDGDSFADLNELAAVLHKVIPLPPTQEARAMTPLPSQQRVGRHGYGSVSIGTLTAAARLAAFASPTHPWALKRFLVHLFCASFNRQVAELALFRQVTHFR